jgi:hypothetical protein
LRTTSIPTFIVEPLASLVSALNYVRIIIITGVSYTTADKADKADLNYLNIEVKYNYSMFGATQPRFDCRSKWVILDSEISFIIQIFSHGRHSQDLQPSLPMDSTSSSRTP